METVTAPQDNSSGADPNNVKSEDGNSRQEGGRQSPPPNCAICLGRCRNKSFTDSCLHQFCFKCLVTWSKVKTECPLCKQNFKSIIHNVKSNHQYEEYPVEQHREVDMDRINMRELVAATRRYRFRATLTMPRNNTTAFQQFLMHYPISAMMSEPLPAPLGGSAAPRPRRRASPASFRRTVYRHNLWARPLPDFTGRFRDCSPEFYRYNDSQLHRLVPWLNRELHYLLNENAGHIAYVLSRILELLPQYHMSSVEFRDAVQRYFGDRTEHFLHELYCFASTPYDLTGYDRNVQYSSDSRISTMVNEVISGSESDGSGDSDIVVISSSHPSDARPAAASTSAGPSRHRPSPAYPQSYIPQSAAPGIVPIETISNSDTDDDSSEVMVVGYIKPPHQRTPEVVDLLGSDSDDVVVQEPAPSPGVAAAPAPEAPARSATLVKLTLTRHPTPPSHQDSDSDESYTPPPPPVVAAPRGRRRARLESATTSDTSRGTPSPSPSPASSPRSPSSTSSSETFTSLSSSFSSSDSFSLSPRRRSRPTKRKSTKQSTSRSRNKSRKKAPRAQKKDKKKADGRDKTKRKSKLGKDVKSSKTSRSKPEPAEPVDDAEPGPSGVPNNLKRRRDGPSRHGRESKRLRSVVNVMKRSSEESSTPRVGEEAGGVRTRGMRNSSSSTARLASASASGDDVSATRYDSTSDSEDNVPLNLTVHK